MIHFSNHKHSRFHCKVVAIYVLVMENNNELLLPRVKFPLAGCVIDDGSSACCCWADNERVVMLLLGSHEEGQGPPWKRSRKSLLKSKKMEMSRMRRILDQHGSVVIKNSGNTDLDPLQLSYFQFFNIPININKDDAVGLSRNLINVLEDAIKNGYLIVVIAEDIEQEALATLVVYKLRGALKIAALKAPGFGERKKQYLDDIAILIGGTVIRDEVGLTLDKVDSSVLGHAAEVVHGKDYTTIVGDGSAQVTVGKRVLF
ncbi:hypothetical protein L1887_19868 [Cichorium endivia]|nr:hypothetical protein L1887_19868 [Cichorium endivia]